MSVVALDLFAGTGWGVACQRLGIEEHGVELMPEAVASREAAGMSTIYHDVWEGLDGQPRLLTEHETEERRAAFSRVFDLDSGVGLYDLLIASPPCQTFSMAGSGKGRAALDEVLALIHSRAFLHPHELRAFGERHDPRTALVLTPLAHVARDTPRLVVFEQVPTVLPVWEACAEVMREWGYSVVTGILNAEQYGVPQTRKRAILVARWDDEARMPTPTHSLYHVREPEKLDDGVLPWVSMAEALGWGMTARPYLTVSGGANDGTPGGHTGGQDPGMLGGSAARARLNGERDGGRWLTPATTVAGDERQAVRVTPQEAAILQSYPVDFPFAGGKGKVSLQIGNAVPPKLAEAILRSLLT